MNDMTSEDSICKELGLATIYIPQLLKSPLPLQCLAAEALSDELKQEIEQVTDSSIKEIKRASSSTEDSYKRDSGTGTEEIDCEPTIADKSRETIVSVPLQFFSNGVGLKIVGGVKCLHSNERHAQIIYVSGRKDRENIPEQVAALHGRCILDFNGHSLRGATFEKVRKITMATKDILVNLTLTDCSGDPSSPAADNTSPRGIPPPVKIRLNQTTNKRQLFRRRFSVGDINGGVRSGSSQSLGPLRTTTTMTPPTSRATPPTNNGGLGTKTKSVTDLKQPTKAVDSGNGNTRKTSLGETTTRNETVKEEMRGTNSPAKTAPAASVKRPDDVMAQFSLDMPKGMIQLAFNYVKAHKTLYVSLFKIKFHSLTIGSEPSGCFFNTQIFPDKREQGVKFSKIIPSTLSTEEVYTRSASYILTESETTSTSIRIIIWEQSGQSLGNKNFTFKGEVFLALNDEEIVNLHGVVQTYSICEVDPNLPSLPKAHYVSSGGGGGKLMKKVMDSTLGAMTMRRRKKSGHLLPDVVPKSGSLMDLTDDTQELPAGTTGTKPAGTTGTKPDTNIKRMLEPLKPPPRGEDPPIMCQVMLRPATTESRSPSEQRGMSLIDFLNTLDPSRSKVEEEPKQKKGESKEVWSSKTEDTDDPELRLPPKSPLSSSCQDLRPAQLSEPNKRRASVISDGTQTVATFSRHKKLRGSIHSLFDSFGRPYSRHSQTNSQPGSHNSMLLSDSDLSSSISSLSMDKQKDGGQQRGWSEEVDKPEHSYSEISLIVPQLTTSNHSLPTVTTTNTNVSPLHSSIVFHPSPSPDRSFSSSTDSLRLSGDARGSTNSESSYTCEQVPVILSDPETFSPSSDSNQTVTVHTNNDSSTNTTNTFKEVTSNSELSPSLASLSPSTRNRLIPISSTPKRSHQDSGHHVPQSKSMGNMSDMLFFMGSEDGDTTSLSEFMEKELSCLDVYADNFLSSQDSNRSGISLTSSQREALECSTNSSSLDYCFIPPSPPDLNSSQDRLDKPSLQGFQSRKTFSNNSTDPHNQSLPIPTPKHKWSSMDDLQTSSSTPKLISKSPATTRQSQKKASRSLTEKLSLAYKKGKSLGTAKLSIEALCVSSQIKLNIEDLLFFDQKLMNGEYSLRVNLYNSISDRCEKSLKGQVSLRKNHMEETKIYTPSSFVFSGNPMMYYLQIILQLSNKLFGKRRYHVWIDLKKLTTDSYEQTDWFNVTQLSV